MTTCGDWTEHYSSTGKKYYYNCKTEVSQWEKPKDWTDVEKSRSAAGQVAKLHCDRNSRSSQVRQIGLENFRDLFVSQH